MCYHVVINLSTLVTLVSFLTEAFLVTRYAPERQLWTAKADPPLLLLFSFAMGNPEATGITTRSKDRPNSEKRGDVREYESLERQRLQRIWDEGIPALEDARDDPFLSADSIEEDVRRLIDFFAPYTQVPLPESSTESEGQENTRHRGGDTTPPSSPALARYVSFACAATSPTPPPTTEGLISRASRDENQAPEQETAHRLQRIKQSASRMREGASRGRSLLILTRRDAATSSRPTSQERPVSKEECREIRV